MSLDATIYDIQEIKLLLRNFHAAAETPAPFNDADVERLLRGMIESPAGIVLKQDAGIIGGLSLVTC